MVLFQRISDGSSLTFNCAGLSDDELQNITKLVEENGGKVGDCVLPLIFMPKDKYREELHLQAFRVYDIDYIKICIQADKLVDIRTFRLGAKKCGDYAIISLFIYGVCCKHSAKEKSYWPLVATDSALSSDSEDSGNNGVRKRMNLSRSCGESRVINPCCIKRCASAEDLTKPQLMSFNSQDTFHTAMDDIVIKSECDLDTEKWQCISNLMEKHENFDLEVPVDAHPKNSPRPKTEQHIASLKSPDPESSRSPPSSALIESNLHQSPIKNNKPQIVPNQKHVTGTKNKLPKITITNPQAAIETAEIPKPTKENQSKLPENRRVECINSEIIPKASQSNAPEPMSINEDTFLNKTRKIDDEVCSLNIENASAGESGPWIAPCDDWITTGNKCNRVYPTEDFMDLNNGKAPLLRVNVTAQQELNMRNQQIQEDSTTCDEEDEIPATPTKVQKQNNNRNNTVKAQQSQDTLKAKKNKEIRIIASEPILIRGKNTLPSNRHEIVSCENSKPGPSGLNAIIRNYAVSDSDSGSDKVDNTIRRTNPQKRRYTKKSNSDQDGAKEIIVISSDSEEEDKAPVVKRKKYDKVADRRTKGKLRHAAFDSLPEAKKHSTALVISDDSHVDSDTDASNKNKDNFIDESCTDDDIRELPSQKARIGTKLKRKKKALKYAKDWRGQLESNRVDKQEVTRMKFTDQEQSIMVKFLCSHEDIERVQPKGLKIWNRFLNRGHLPNRTAQSLQNHFVKHLLPRISNFFSKMSSQHKRQFEAMQIATGRKCQ